MTYFIKFFITLPFMLLCFNHELRAEPFKSTYQPLPSINVLIKNANISRTSPKPNYYKFPIAPLSERSLKGLPSGVAERR